MTQPSPLCSMKVLGLLLTLEGDIGLLLIGLRSHPKKS